MSVSLITVKNSIKNDQKFIIYMIIIFMFHWKTLKINIVKNP